MSNSLIYLSNINFLIQIGWLSSKQEFQLEIFGPYITCLPNEIKPNNKNSLFKY